MAGAFGGIEMVCFCQHNQTGGLWLGWLLRRLLLFFVIDPSFPYQA
jgi:hypothetical protein